MESIQIDLFVVLGFLEFALVISVIAALFALRSRRLARRVQALREQLDQPAEVPQAVGFDQYLRDEIIRNQAFIDQAAATQDSRERSAGEALAMRKQFLELELTAQASKGNPVQFCQTLTEGMRSLIEQLRPEPETVIETATADAPVAESAAKEPAEDSAAKMRELRDTHQDELGHLRKVINNQQDAMGALRARLKDSEGEIAGMEGIHEKLDEFERQSLELQQSLQVLEAENERLKLAKRRNEPGSAKDAERDPAQLSGLKNMVGKQQATISSLQDLIRELAPEASKARELQEAIAQIQRTNQELNGCVAVLEDENNMLRDELAEIQAYLDAQERTAAEAVEAAEMQGDQSSEDMMRELEIKVQELEALVEFKDAAIEEMEKQYNALQARYLAATGKKKVD